MELKTALIITITIISFGLAAWMFPGKIAKDVFNKKKYSQDGLKYWE